MTSTNSWAVNADGDWSVARYWSRGVTPGSGDDVVIATSTKHTVTHGSGNDTVNSLTLGNDVLAISGGSLTINGNSTSSGTLSITNAIVKLYGTFAGGVITDAGGGLRLAGSATLDGVSYHGTLTMNANSANFFIKDGLAMTGLGGTGAGTLNMSSNDNAFLRLYFNGTQTLDNATVYIGNTNSLGYSDNILAYNGTLTLSAKTKIISAGNNAFLTSATGSEAIVNNGTITAGSNNGSFSINPRSFVNNGTITVTNNDTLYVSTIFTNYGRIVLNNGGTIDFQASVTTAQLGTFANTTGTLQIDGTLNNAGATLNIGQGRFFGQVQVNSGAISGGVIIDAGSGLYASGGLLDSVAYEGTLDLSQPYSLLHVSGGLNMTDSTGAGTGTVDLTASDNTYHVLYFNGSQTFDNATVYIGVTSGSSTRDSIIVNGGTLTLGAGINIVTVGDGGSLSAAYGSEGVINYGAITASAGGVGFTINTGVFTNYGALTVGNGDTLYLQPTNFTNLSGTTLTGGSYEADAGSTIELAPNQRIVIDNAAITLSDDGSTIESYNSATGTEITLDSTLTTIGAAGSLQISGTRNFTTGAAFSNFGDLILDGSTFTAASLTNYAGSSLSGAGIVATAVNNAGTIEASDGVLTIQKTITGSGGFMIDSGATLALTAPISGNVTFAGPGATLSISGAAAFSTYLSGLVSGDQIDLVNVSSNDIILNASNQLVVVTQNGAVGARLNLTGSVVGLGFVAQSDGGGGTLISVTGTPGPAVTGKPGNLATTAKVATPVRGITIADPALPSGSIVSVVVTSSTGGTFNATAAPGATVASAGSRSIKLRGSVAGVNAELATLTYTGSTVGSHSWDMMDVLVYDASGSGYDARIRVALNQPPVTHVPTKTWATAGQSLVLGGIYVQDIDAVAANETLTVVISDATGLLSATAASGATVAGSGTKTVTLKGSRLGVNAELATLTYVGATLGAPSADVIDIATSDGRGGSDDHKLSVLINQPPAINAPSKLSLTAKHTVAVPGISVTDAGRGSTFTAVITDLTGLLAATAAPGATVKGAGTVSLTLVGSLDALNAELSSLTYTGAASGVPKNDTIDIAVADGGGGVADAKIKVAISAATKIESALLQMTQAMSAFVTDPGVSSIAISPQALQTHSLLTASHHLF